MADLEVFIIEIYGIRLQLKKFEILICTLFERIRKRTLLSPARGCRDAGHDALGQGILATPGIACNQDKGRGAHR